MSLKLVTPKFGPDEDVEALFDAKLASSGIPRTIAEEMGWRWETAEQTKSADSNYWNLPSLVMPYVDPWSKLPMRARPNWPVLERRRALRDPVPRPDKFAKYLSPSGAGTGVFFPPIVDWAEILANPKTPLIVTEGEMKAVKATIEGLPTIGLGGVNSYKAIRQGYAFLPELEKINWVRREVFIVYDSDVRTNPNVLAALMDLAKELQERGALPRTAVLPSEDGQTKVGLDDLIVSKGVAALKSLLLDAEHLTVAESLWRMNDNFVYVESPGVIVRQRNGQLIKPEAFRNHVTTESYTEGKLLSNGNYAFVKVNAADPWVRWEFRSTVDRIAYLPGKPKLSIVQDDSDTSVYNIWTGWACEPKKGPVKLFEQLIDHIFTGSEPWEKKYFWQWMAFQVQNPGIKMLVCVLIHGIEQGTGKSLIGVTLERLFGENYAAVTQDSTTGQFNHWARGRQFVMMDDVSGSDKRRDLDRLKTMITQKSIWINEKHQAEYSIRDCINYYISSNHQDVLFLEQMDRRFFVWEVKVGPLSSQFYQEYDLWMNGPDCGPAIFYHLLNVDLEGFNPNAAPPMNSSKRKMIQLARTDIVDWITRMLETPDEYLCLGEIKLRGDMFTLAEVRACFEGYQGKPLEMSSIGLSRQLASQGVRQLEEGKNIYIPGRKLNSYWILRNRERWHKASVDVAKRHLGEITAANKMRGG